MLSCFIRFTITDTQLFSDGELIYLYRQGNEWALEELENKFLPLMQRGINTSKKELENLGYDEAECISQCHLVFLQCIDYYCEDKEVEFFAYVRVRLQYQFIRYRQQLYRRQRYETSYEVLYDDHPVMTVRDYQSNPAKMVEYHETTQLLKNLSEVSVGLEKTIIYCMLAGYTSKEMAKYLPYDRRMINNALYRIRKKIKKAEENTIKSRFTDY